MRKFIPVIALCVCAQLCVPLQEKIPNNIQTVLADQRDSYRQIREKNRLNTDYINNKKHIEKLKENKRREEVKKHCNETLALKEEFLKKSEDKKKSNNDYEVHEKSSVKEENYQNLRAVATNGCDIYYSKITDKEPQITIGSAFSVPDKAREVGAAVAINAGMGYENGGVYYAYGELYHGYSGHQSGDTLVLKNNGWLDDCYVTSENVTTLGVKWAVKGLNCYTYDGEHTGYADCGVHPYSFIAQDYDGAYYVGAFSYASFSTMHSSLKKIIPNIKLMYATEGGGMVKYVENGDLIFNGRGQYHRYSNAMIWF